jgi:hypothetical protein
MKKSECTFLLRSKLARKTTSPSSILLLQQAQKTKTLLLTPLLLVRHNLETTIIQLILGLLLFRHRTRILLGNFTPTTSLRGTGSGTGRFSSIDQSLVGELASADELFGEVARVDCVGDAVDGFGHDFEF